MVRKLGALLALAGMMAAVPAQAACWRAEEADAAAIRDLQTMLMVTTLRCRAAGLATTAAYDMFVIANRPMLEASNATLRAHFAAETDAMPAQARYDRFATWLANGYGAGATTPESCAAAGELIAVATAAAGSRAALLRIADARGAPPVERCGGPAVQTAAAALPGFAESATPAAAPAAGGSARLAFAIPD